MGSVHVEPTETLKPAKLIKPDIPRVPAPGSKRSSNGIEMLPSETEEWAGWCQLLGSSKTKNVPCWPAWARLVAKFKACCCCDPHVKGGRMAEMLVTDQRLVVRELKHKESGRSKGCMYYACCCCCLPQTLHTTYIEDHTAFELADIKEFTMAVKHLKTENTGCCGCLGFCGCCRTAYMAQEFAIQLTLTKDVGTFLPAPWVFEVDNKTSYVTVTFEGEMDLANAASLRTVLDAVVARNAAAAKEEVKVNRNLNN